jgi:hypothetical protein
MTILLEKKNNKLAIFFLILCIGHISCADTSPEPLSNHKYSLRKVYETVVDTAGLVYINNNSVTILNSYNAIPRIDPENDSLIYANYLHFSNDSFYLDSVISKLKTRYSNVKIAGSPFNMNTFFYDSITDLITKQGDTSGIVQYLTSKPLRLTSTFNFSNHQTELTVFFEDTCFVNQMGEDREEVNFASHDFDNNGLPEIVVVTKFYTPSITKGDQLMIRLQVYCITYNSHK